MLRVFKPNDKIYDSNGDAVIVPIKARVKNSDNGDFTLDLTCDTKYNKVIKDRCIIVADTPQGAQAFRVRTITKRINRLEVKAWHVFYDSENYVIADSYAVNKTCDGALTHFNLALDQPTPFMVYSDISTVNNLRIVRESFKDTIDKVIERWGGHLIRDNYSIHVKNSAQLGSEGADKTQGYRLYIDGSTSYLDVDEINVRHGLKAKQYKEILFEDFNILLR
jgi:phage-related protein